MSCIHCAEGEYPIYGVAPHECYWKIPGAVIGESRILPKDRWPPNFTPDPDAPNCGTYECPACFGATHKPQEPT